MWIYIYIYKFVLSWELELGVKGWLMQIHDKSFGNDAIYIYARQEVDMFLARATVWPEK